MGDFSYAEEDASLTAGALQQIRSTGAKYDGEVVVQVLQVKQLESRNFQLIVSDSMDCCPCNVASKLRLVLSSGALGKLGVIRITHHVVNKVGGHPVIIALAMEVVAATGSQVVGNPYGREAPSADLTPSAKPAMTIDQRKRIEANRLAAMERKRSRVATSVDENAKNAAEVSRTTEVPRKVPKVPSHKPRVPPLFPGRDEDCDLNAVDAALSSCFGPGIVSECHGVAGSGKSFLGAMLGAYALARDPRAHVLFMVSNGENHAARRAVSVARGRLGRLLGRDEAGHRILLTQCTEPEKLVEDLSTRVPAVVAGRRVSLVVVDTVADVLRQADAARRDGRSTVRRIVAAIRRCAQKTRCAFFLVNQVVADFGAGANAVVACNDAAIAEVATSRFRLTRGTHPAVSHLRYITATTAPPDENGDVPTSAFIITKTGLQPAHALSPPRVD